MPEKKKKGMPVPLQEDFYGYGKRIESVYIRSLPSDLKDEFKAACSKRKYSMQDVIVALMEFYVEGGYKNPHVKVRRNRDYLRQRGPKGIYT